MTIDDFWTLIESVHRDAGGQMPEKCKLVKERLEALPPEEVLSYIHHFQECCDRAYNWELWCAGYVIHGGCSDDSFSDFRATFVSHGRSVFEQALADPDALAEMNLQADALFYEGFQYQASTVYRQKAGERPRRGKLHPQTPSGVPWEEKDAGTLCPKLAAKYS